MAHGWRRRSDSDPTPYFRRSNGEGRVAGQQGYKGDKQTVPFNKGGKKKLYNPSGSDGKPYRCYYCDSIMHLKENCPHRGQTLKAEQIILFIKSEDQLALLVRESWDSMVLDSACTKTVCGKPWLDEYTSGLDPVAKQEVISSETPSDSTFKFGNDGRLPSLKRVLLPCNVAGENIKIETNVVDSSIPLLLSLESMKKAQVVWDMANQEISFLGRKVPLDTTSCGHHCIAIKPEHVKINDCFTVLESTNDEAEAKKIIIKLHKQFGHPTKDNMISLLKDAGYCTENYQEIIDVLYKQCTTCELFQNTPDRPVVAMPEANSFCELVVMDLKVWRMGLYILHIIDAFSRLSISAVIRRKTPQTVAHQFLLKWVGSGFGFPKRMKCDSGGEFNNEKICELGNCVGIEIQSTAAESPWMNGLCERNHAVTDRCLEKILHDDPKVPIEVALAYACNAKNCIQMWNGYSSFQLVFGENPRLPDVYNAELPGLEGRTESEIIAMHLNTLQSARKAFIETQACQRIKKALKHRVRAKMEHFKTGDKVIYKRSDSNRWRGPGTVIGQNRQIIFVQHGGQWYKIPNCRVQKAGQVLLEQTSGQLENDEDLVVDQESSWSDGDLEETNGELVGSGGESEVHSTGEGVTAAGEGSRVTQEDASTADIAGNSNGDVVPEGAGSVEKSGRCLPPKGSMINFRMPGEEAWRRAEVLGPAGKATGVNKDLLNIKEGDNKLYINTKKVQDLHIEEEVNVVMIPRREHNRPEIIKAKMTELAIWKDLNVYEVVPDEGQPRIGTCWVVTPKVKDGKNGYKARLVCRGDQEAVNVPTDSPTCSKSGLRIFLAVSVACGFPIQSKDVKSAFLQGKALQRDVFVEPPQELKKPGMIWRLLKVAYGLSDAARNWYESSMGEMIKLGCKRSIYENALFYYKYNSKLQGLSVTHVDDFLDAGNRKFKTEILKSIKNSFIIGSEAENDFEYVGVNLEKKKDGITLDQLIYCRSVEGYELSNERKQQRNDCLTSEKMKGYRKIVGCLNWVATVTRPDLSFDVVSLSTHFKNAKIENLIAANKAVRKLQGQEVAVYYPRLVVNEKLRVLLYTDSAYKNLNDGISSCGGYIMFLVDMDNRCCPIQWRSNKIRRIVTSTLAAEALALEDGIKDAIFQRAIIKELFDDLPLEIICFVDNKGVVDAVHSTHAVEDRLTRLTIATIQEHLRKKEIVAVHHIHGVDMIADCLTKHGASPKLLLDVMQAGFIPVSSLNN